MGFFGFSVGFSGFLIGSGRFVRGTGGFISGISGKTGLSGGLIVGFLGGGKGCFSGFLRGGGGLFGFFNPVSYESLRLEFQKAAFKAGIQGEKICTHSLRRSGLTKLNNQGVNLRLIQFLAGHQNLSTTQSYLEVTEQQQQAALNAI